MGDDQSISAAAAQAARQSYVQAARLASQAGSSAEEELCAAHSAFVIAMLELGQPGLALDAAHALLAARPNCARSRVLVAQLRSAAAVRDRAGAPGEIPASSSMRNVSI